jgi:ATP-dependent Clp protease ATP-binding subunit ClpC
MFERYSESARKTLFFARYEASQLGSRVIETEHVLLGLLRQMPEAAARALESAHVSATELRSDLRERVVYREKFATSIEIPFSVVTKRALQAAAEEADRLGHGYIAGEHLLLGLLAVEEGSIAATVLTRRGLRLADMRTSIVGLLSDRGLGDAPAHPSVVDTDARLTLIKQLVSELLRAPRDSPRAYALAERINVELDTLRANLA